MKSRFFLLILIMVVILSGCNTSNVDKNDQVLAPNKVVQEPSNGGEISIGVDLQSMKLDPLGYGKLPSPINNINPILYRGLMQYNGQIQLIPDIAKDIAINQNDKTIKIVLNKGLKWEDGSPLTIDDVLATIEWYSQRAYAGRWKEKTLDITGTELYRRGKEEHVLGLEVNQENQSLVIKYDKLDVTNLEFLTAPILSKKQLENKTIDEVKTMAIEGKLLSSGPFKLESRSQTEWTFVRNDFYQDTALLERVRFSDVNQNKKANLIFALPDVFNKMKSSKRVERLPGIGYQYLGMNLQSPYYKDPHVRNALSIVLDIGKLNDNVYEGYAEQPLSPIHPQSWAYKGIEKDGNIEEAKALLQTKKLDLTLVYEDSPIYSKLAEEIAKQLNEVSVNVKLNPIVSEEYIPTLFSKGEYDFFLATWSYEYDPVKENGKWLSKNSVTKGGFNVSQLQDPVTDSILLNGTKTMYTEKRFDIYGQWQEYFMNKSFIIPLSSPQVLLLEDPTLHVSINNAMVPYYTINEWWSENNPS